MTAKYDLVLDRETDYRREIRWFTGPDKEQVDFSGYRARIDARQWPGSGSSDRFLTVPSVLLPDNYSFEEYSLDADVPDSWGAYENVAGASWDTNSISKVLRDVSLGSSGGTFGARLTLAHTGATVGDQAGRQSSLIPIAPGVDYRLNFFWNVTVLSNATFRVLIEYLDPDGTRLSLDQSNIIASAVSNVWAKHDSITLAPPDAATGVRLYFVAQATNTVSSLVAYVDQVMLIHPADVASNSIPDLDTYLAPNSDHIALSISNTLITALATTTDPVFYDLVVEDTTGKATKLMEGRVVVRPTYTDF